MPILRSVRVKRLSPKDLLMLIRTKGKLDLIWRTAHSMLRKVKFHKGQLISKWFLGSSISSKKWTKEFDFTTMRPQVDLFSFIFWRKSTTPKNHFKINWPLAFPGCILYIFWFHFSLLFLLDFFQKQVTRLFYKLQSQWIESRVNRHSFILLLQSKTSYSIIL